MSNRKYTEEFKREAIKQVTERGYKTAEVAQRLGISLKSMFKEGTHRSEDLPDKGRSTLRHLRLYRGLLQPGQTPQLSRATESLRVRKTGYLWLCYLSFIPNFFSTF